MAAPGDDAVVASEMSCARWPAIRLTRVWAGGLVSDQLGLAGEGAIDLTESFLWSSFSLGEAYDITEVPVGSGGFGIACPAFHRATGRHCIMKSVSKQLAGEKYRQSLVETGGFTFALQITRDFGHNNIVGYFDMLESSEYYFIVMERVEGRELFDQLGLDFPVSEIYCQSVMKQIFLPLKHLHEDLHVMHRDVKLENFRFAQKEGVPDLGLKLLDFGMARFINQAWDHSICGTVMYLAPEVVTAAALPKGTSLDGGYSTAVDLWATGVIFYVLLTGEPPFSDPEVWKFGAECADLVAKVLEADALKFVSSEALDLLKQLFLVDPESRIAASKALEHPWFSLSAAPQRPAVLHMYARDASKSVQLQHISSSSFEIPGFGE